MKCLAYFLIIVFVCLVFSNFSSSIIAIVDNFNMSKNCLMIDPWIVSFFSLIFNIVNIIICFIIYVNIHREKETRNFLFVTLASGFINSILTIISGIYSFMNYQLSLNSEYVFYDSKCSNVNDSELLFSLKFTFIIHIIYVLIFTSLFIYKICNK